MREQYRAEGFSVADLAPGPMEQFGRWFREAAEAAVLGGLYEPNAMVLSTVGADGAPTSRTVLMKRYDSAGFVFFTDYRSRKARSIEAEPRVALLFPWHSMARQVQVTGTASRVSAEETAAYFRSRPHGSRIGAWASPQSQQVSSRQELEERYAEFSSRWPEGSEIPVPDHWGGFRVVPDSVEFWQGRRNRLHDRLRYVRSAAETDTDGPAREGTTPRAEAARNGAAEDGAFWRVERLGP